MICCFLHQLVSPTQVQVSMKFNGQSSVEVQPHSSVEELKTVTSISLFIRVDPDKDPIEDRFILYLGDRSVSQNAERRRGLLEKQTAGMLSGNIWESLQC